MQKTISNRAFHWYLGAIVSVVVAWPAVAMAAPPPVDFALAAIGEVAEDRRDKAWSMTHVDEKVMTLCAKDIDSDGAVFSDGEQSLTMSSEAELPWGLIWAVLWSGSPGDELSAHVQRWDEATARVEAIDGTPVFCYGDDKKLCVDDEVRRIEVLEIEIDETTWRLRASREGTRLQVTEDGSLVARLAAEEC